MTHWHTLPGPAQVALAWAVNIGGHAWTSELAALADLEAAGLLVWRGEWTVSDDHEGRNGGKPCRQYLWTGGE